MKPEVKPRALQESRNDSIRVGVRAREERITILNHLIADSNLGTLYQASTLCYIAHRKTASDGFEAEIFRCQLVEAVRKWQGWLLECSQPVLFRYIPMVLKQLRLEETENNVLHIERNEETGEFCCRPLEVDLDEEAGMSADEDLGEEVEAVSDEESDLETSAIEVREPETPEEEMGEVDVSEVDMSSECGESEVDESDASDATSDPGVPEKDVLKEPAAPEVDEPAKSKPVKKEKRCATRQFVTSESKQPKPEEQPQPKKQAKTKNTEAVRAKKEPTKMETNNGKCIALTVTNNDKSVPIAVFPTESEALDLKEVLESLADVGVTSRNAKYELFEALHRGFGEGDGDSAEKDKKIADLEGMNELYASENDDLEKQIADLKEKCSALEKKNQLSDGKKSEGSKVRDLFRTLPSTSSEALRRAADVWADRLVVLDSAYKSAEDWDGSVAETWEVLTSIATELWQMSFEETPTDFCEEFKARTGFELSLRESKETRRNLELMRLRTVVYKGSKVTAGAHVKGHSRKKGIRVHYHVDKDLQLIVITHCGRHLKTAGSKRKGY